MTMKSAFVFLPSTTGMKSITPLAARVLRKTPEDGLHAGLSPSGSGIPSKPHRGINSQNVQWLLCLVDGAQGSA